MHSEWTRVRDGGVWIWRTLIKIGSQLSHAEGIENLRGRCHASHVDKGLAEVADTLQISRDGAQKVLPLIEPQVVIAAEQEEFVLHDGPGDCAANLVHFEGRPRQAVGIV